MEEILRLEREIERLQKQQEDGVSLLGDVSHEELRQMRDAEIYRLEKEASRVATEFLDLLDFGGLEPSLSSEENLHDPAESTAPLAEEEVDEGFHAEEECVPLPDFPPPAAVPLDKAVFRSIPPPPPAFAEGLVVVAASSSASSAPPAKLSPLTPNGLSRGPALTDSRTSRPPALPPAVTNGEMAPCHRASRGSDFEPASGEAPHPNLPDGESDYDQEEFEEAHGSSGHVTDEEVLRKSSCTQNSLDSFRGSSDSVRTKGLAIISVQKGSRLKGSLLRTFCPEIASHVRSNCEVKIESSSGYNSSPVRRLLSVREALACACASLTLVSMYRKAPLTLESHWTAVAIICFGAADERVDPFPHS